MDISIKTTNQVITVELSGELNGKTVILAQEEVIPLTTKECRILLDMTKVTYMSSAGLRMLLSLYRQISNSNGRMTLVGLTEEIKDTMSVTGFLNFFTIRDTLDSGLETLN